MEITPRFNEVMTEMQTYDGLASRLHVQQGESEDESAFNVRKRAGFIDVFNWYRTQLPRGTTVNTQLSRDQLEHVLADKYQQFYEEAAEEFTGSLPDLLRENSSKLEEALLAIRPAQIGNERHDALAKKHAGYLQLADTLRAYQEDQVPEEVEEELAKIARDAFKTVKQEALTATGKRYSSTLLRLRTHTALIEFDTVDVASKKKLIIQYAGQAVARVEKELRDELAPQAVEYASNNLQALAAKDAKSAMYTLYQVLSAKEK